MIQPRATALAAATALALTALIFAVLALLVRAGAGFLVGPVIGWFGMPGTILLAQLPAVVLNTPVLRDGGGLGVMGLALMVAFVQLAVVLGVVLYLRVFRRR